MAETNGPDYKVQNKTYEIEIGGQVYKVRKPKYHEHREMINRTRDGGDEQAVDITLENLVALGLPESAPEDLDIDDILEISKIVLGGKKN